ncbi:MAG: dodecin family protein [Acidobacteria bacterium]|jgi:dodecin|nr:dodecin family protein [Acidobacteriota bacterium]
MPDKVYKKLRVTGCSQTSFKHAVELAVAKTAESVRGSAWFEVVELRGAVANGEVKEWQATVDIAFKVD